MTREAQQTKNFFRLNGGLNTEINELQFPDGFTTDEENYELLVDGSRRRRKGLAAESSQAADKATQTFTSSGRQQSYLWRNVGGDPTKDVVVYRQQDLLFFCDAGEIMSSGWASGTGSYVALSAFETSGATTALVDDAALSFAHGRGRLLVSGQYVKPFYVEYDPSTGEYSATEIRILARDFSTIDDGIHMADKPTGTITADHRYNLRNRGWLQDDMDQYDTDLSRHPAKNSIWHYGYKRTYGASISELDGQQSWDSNKIDNEAFGASSAPVGSLFIEPFDSTFGYGIAGSGAGAIDITTWSYVDSGSYWTVTITTASAHGIAVGEDFTIYDNSMVYSFEIFPGEPIDVTTTFNGTWEAKAGTTGSTLIFHWTSEPPNFDSWINQYKSKGYIDDGLSLARSNGTAHTDSTRCVEFHAGRAFYAGMTNTEWADTIFFSQIVQGVESYHKCYQAADPTDREFNAITAADGGTIIIPGLAGVVALKTLRNSLIVLSTEGIWEINGGQRGVFTADGYGVRKLSEIGCSSATSVVAVENTLIFTGPGGIYMVHPNQFTGLLEVTNAIEDTIQTLWNGFTTAEQERCEAFYDDALKRVYFMLGPDGTGIGVNTMLVFSFKAGAWFKYTFDEPTNNVLLTGIAIPDADDPTTNKKAKFLYQTTTDDVNWADFDQTSFNDWDGTNGPLPYMVFGHDLMGEAQRRGQAPIITVYSKRTETGYTDTGSGFDPVNESSTLMRADWDWTDDAVSNKQGAQQQVYRHVRNFVPADANDVDGYPIVVTRNKVRGRGRALQLRFDGAADKDSHILGFTTNFKITRKK